MLIRRASFTGEVVKTDPNQLPVYIDADSAEINQPKNALYQGNVQVEQGNRKLNADSVFVEQKVRKTIFSVMLISMVI